MRFTIIGILALIIIILGSAIKLKQEEKTRKMIVTEEICPYFPVSKSSIYDHFIFSLEHPVLFLQFPYQDADVSFVQIKTPYRTNP